MIRNAIVEKTNIFPPFRQSIGTSLLRTSDMVVEESRAVEDREAAVQLHRLKGKYQMASKSVLHAVDVEARASRRAAKPV